MNHLSLIQWAAIGYAAFTILCVLRLWPRR